MQRPMGRAFQGKGYRWIREKGAVEWEKRVCCIERERGVKKKMGVKKSLRFIELKKKRAIEKVFFFIS